MINGCGNQYRISSDHDPSIYPSMILSMATLATDNTFPHPQHSSLWIRPKFRPSIQSAMAGNSCWFNLSLNKYRCCAAEIDYEIAYHRRTCLGRLYEIYAKYQEPLPELILHWRHDTRFLGKLNDPQYLFSYNSISMPPEDWGWRDIGFRYLVSKILIWVPARQSSVETREFR